MTSQVGYPAAARRIGWVVAALVLIGILLPTASAAVYEKIRVPYPAGRQPGELFFHPDLELMGDDDGAYIILSRPELTAELRARGFDVEVLVPDLEAFYAGRMGKDYGIWHTYQETVDEMNLLHSQFPNLTTAPQSIATTGEGRTVWAMKISDNPGQQENEPEVLFDGMHHAREIMTVEVILHFMRYLCENYGTDPVVTFLVDHRQIWFVPLLNVDGFVYNELTNPNGGGLWRKNRRNNGGCFGVDPNRNYPYEWVGPGSSTDPCSDTYRGPFARSEPEIIGLTAFVNAHTFVTWQSYHSVAGMVLIPWGYTMNPTPDDAVLTSIANVMASAGGYQVGQAPELLYAVNGVTGDWAYGATNEHPRIYPFTTEVGGSDFWPLPSERDGLIAENLYSNIYLCQVAGAYLSLNSLAVAGGDGNGRLDPGESASLVVTAGNPGVLFGVTNVSVSVVCNDPYVVLTDAQSSLGNIGPGASANNNADPFDLSVLPGCPQGRSATFRITLQADGGLFVEETRSLNIGQVPILYANTFETGSDWIQDPSHNAATGAFVRVDPVATSYQPGDDTTPAPGVNAWITAQNPGGAEGTDDVDSGTAATRSPVIDLSSASHVQLDMMYFHGQRDTGDDPTDGFRIDASNDAGASWVNLVQVGDVNYSAIWRNLRIDLEDFLPLTAQMLLRVQAADPGGSGGTGDIVEGGVDDVYLYDMGSGNHPPSAPVRLLPMDGSINQPPSPTLVIANAVDPEGQSLTYGFRVYSDPLCTQLVAAVDDVPQGAGGQTAWSVIPELGNGTHYWRAYASDPSLRGLYSSLGSFGVTGGASVPDGSHATVADLMAGPNPSAGAVSLRYYSPSAVYARIQVFDPTGRVMRQIEGPRWSEGWQEVLWDGRDESGRRVPAGTYWVRLVMPEETRSIRVVRMR